MTKWSGCTGLAVGLLLVGSAFGALKIPSGEEVAIFEATYRVVTESELSSKQFDDAFRTILAAGEKIEVLTLESVRIDDQQGGSGDSKEKQELKDLKQRGRSILQSADAPPSGTASDAAAAAAALNPAASMQGTGKKPGVTQPDQVTLAPGQSIQDRIGLGLQQHSSNTAQGSPGASLWDTSVAAAQAGGVSVSLYAPPAETPQASKLYTGWGLEQEPAQAQPLADSFLQIDRLDFPAPAPAPAGGDWTIRTLKQRDGERQPHYWDSAQGADLAAEAPSLDWGVPQSTHVGASPAAVPVGNTPKLVPHYWDATEPVSAAAPSSAPKDVPQGSHSQIFEHRWRMPNQAVSRVPADGTFPAQMFTASIPALTLEHADISDPSSVPVRLNARRGRVQAASVQDALAASSADSSTGDLEAALGTPASSRRLLIWQAGSEEVKDDAWAREGWDGDVQAAKAAEVEGKAQVDSALDAWKDASKDGDLEKGDKESKDSSTALDSGVADTDQKVLISQNADGVPAKTGPTKGALQNEAPPAGGQPRSKKQPGSKAGRPGVKAGSMAANAGSSASSARVTAEAGQPGKRNGQDGQGLEIVKGMAAVTEGGAQKGPGQGYARQQGKSWGALQRADGGRLRTKAKANAAQPARRQSGSGVGGAAVAQQLSQEDLKSVASLLTIIRENAADKDGMAQLFKPKAMDYIHRAIVQAIADAKAEAAPCKQPPREELPQDLVEMLTGYKQVPRTKEDDKADEEPKQEDIYLREYLVTFRITTAETKFGELLSNAHVFRIIKENLQKKKVLVSSVSADEIIRVMRDGSRWVMNKDKPAGTKEEPKQAQRSGRRLLQDVLSAAPDESLPVRLVSAIKAAAGFVQLRSL
ncbi:g11551 [Coccomyxa viridis]|uniref:G11551 protein n=1 Tax=Coccomyxa viridis TaxID=1274662 RepID=A0ABP1G871_9CHLO